MLKRNIADISIKISSAILNIGGAGKNYGIKKLKNKEKSVKGSVESELFVVIANEVRSHKRTLMTTQRLHVLWQCVLNTCRLPGDVAEVGVFRGGSAYFLAGAYAAMKAAPKCLYAIDTFEGHAEGTITNADTYHKAGMFADTSFEGVKNYLSRFEFVQVKKGEFSSSARGLISGSYRLVHIDTDLYQPTAECLSYFIPKMDQGGIIVVDDYLGKKCPGVTRAVHEFLERHPVFDIWHFQTEQIALVHRPDKYSNGESH